MNNRKINKIKINDSDVQFILSTFYLNFVKICTGADNYICFLRSLISFKRGFILELASFLAHTITTLLLLCHLLTRKRIKIVGFAIFIKNCGILGRLTVV